MIDTQDRPKRALIYTRISRDATGEQRGIQRQEADCRKQAEVYGWDIAEVFSDNSISAYGDKVRPGWEKALLAIEAGAVDVVLCYHLDRLTRNMHDLERLILLSERTGVGIKAVTGDVDLTTDMGRMIARILAAVARQEVERKGARQKAANQDRASRGEPWMSGWRPFGYQLDMTVIPSEAELVVQAAHDVLNGASLKSVARRWRDLGVSTPRSDKGAEGWTHNGVKSILLNPRNAGLNTYKREVTGDGNWEPLISTSIHHQLVALLTDPSRLTRTTGSAGRRPSNLLTGVARCARCGETVNAGSSNGKPVYKCKREHVNTPRTEADALVISSISMASLSTLPGTVFDIPPADDVDDLWEQIESLRTRQATIARSFATGALDEGAWKAANDSINADLYTLEQRMADSSEGLGRDVRALQQDSVQRFQEMDLDGQRAVLLRLAEVTLHPRQKKKNVPMKQQVSVFLTTRRSGQQRMLPVVAEHPVGWAAMKEGRSIWTEPPSRESADDTESDEEATA